MRIHIVLATFYGNINVCPVFDHLIYSQNCKTSTSEYERQAKEDKIWICAIRFLIFNAIFGILAVRPPSLKRKFNAFTKEAKHIQTAIRKTAIKKSAQSIFIKTTIKQKGEIRKV